MDSGTGVLTVAKNSRRDLGEREGNVSGGSECKWFIFSEGIKRTLTVCVV